MRARGKSFGCPQVGRAFKDVRRHCLTLVALLRVDRPLPKRHATPVEFRQSLLAPAATDQVCFQRLLLDRARPAGQELFEC